MKKIKYIVPLLAIVLVGCRKTDEAFEAGRYNSSKFDENYYVNEEWETISHDESQFKIGEIKQIVNPMKFSIGIPNNGSSYGFEVKNLIEEEDKFSYGYLSKLYDGRLRCDGLTTRSRVQLNKTGYGTFFPKEYRGSESFAFALRGATTIPFPDNDHDATRKSYTNIRIDATFKFYIRQEGTNVYDEVDFVFNDLKISSDNHGSTTYVEVIFDDEIREALYGADAMSFEYNLSDLSQYNGYEITDDYTSDLENAKYHFAIMLYEILLPGSVWY